MRNLRLCTIIVFASLALAPLRAYAILIDFGAGTPMLIESDHYSSLGLTIYNNADHPGCPSLDCSSLVASTGTGTDSTGLYLSAYAADLDERTIFELYFGSGVTEFWFDWATNSDTLFMSADITIPETATAISLNSFGIGAQLAQGDG